MAGAGGGGSHPGVSASTGMGGTGSTGVPPLSGIDGAWDKPKGEPEITVSADSVKFSRHERDIVSELQGWWEQTAHDEVAQLVAKMTEYGGLSRATDLTEIGRHLVEGGVKVPAHDTIAGDEEYLQELGIYFYIVGKMARWSAAIKEGRSVSDDTLLDIGIYVRMAQRARHSGGWPV